ncbi:cytochrome C oxidase subunit IV family protein [Panacagrimonas sp.]|uniref:cytochrome C oxidase subunit IV family protein n=1 Tax=Panacagrimonas sp. TaxID=2480088 RepID=UPI003B525E70
MKLLRTPLTWVWLLLAALTLISFMLGTSHRAQAGTSVSAPALWSAVALVLISFAKVRMIIFHFMEVQHAPWPLKRVCDVWIVVVAGAIVLTYLGVGQPAAKADDTATASTSTLTTGESR